MIITGNVIKMPDLSAIKANENEVARIKCEDMRDKKYFSHTSPTYGSPFDMMRNFGISYMAAVENIAMGQVSPVEVMKSWMNSPGHKQNTLRSNCTQIGVGYASGSHWDQMFIGK